MLLYLCSLVLIVSVIFLVRIFCVVSCELYLFFFFKQKTAYEMRISDWSSDVCSSDLTGSSRLWGEIVCGASTDWRSRFQAQSTADHDPKRATGRLRRWGSLARFPRRRCCAIPPRRALPVPVPRSEEHTSELQSLMRISYAVFCLNNKKKNKSSIP